MRVKDLGSRPAPAAFREMFSRMLRGQSPAIPVQRRQIPYWQERGWSKEGHFYTGNYQTPYAAFQGWIEEQRSGRNFYLYAPSEQIRHHSHWVCFQDRGKNWYLVHMGKEPKDASSGILTIERLITEAYEQ